MSILEAYSSQNSNFSTPTKPKRRRYPREPEPEFKTPQPPEPATPQASSASDIWKWVLRSEAIAPCFVRDVFKMRRHEIKDEEYYWIGNIPCRTIRIVGMIVGVQRFDKKVVYTIDDGTAVIDCIHKTQPAAQIKNNDTKKTKVTIDIPELAKPIANIGALLQTVGRVQEFYESRQIIVESLEKCTSANEEPFHWRTVLSLHETKYSSSAPFVIPASDSSAVLDNVVSGSEFGTPSSTIMSTLSSSVATSSAAPSPTKSTASSQRSPNKLRHPSRLHSQDLTANTFRIYLKHYMDNPPSVSDDTDLSDQDDYGPLSSPTKRQRTPLNRAVSSCHNTDPEATPRPSCATYIPKSQSSQRIKMMNTMNPPLRGFTLSYLRRVPELSDMARRVCKAETKRREREARKKAREANSNKSQSRSRSQISQPSSKSTAASNSVVQDKENSTSARIKRLFRWAILRLIEDGSIVIWPGPAYPCSTVPGNSIHNTLLWKYSSSSSSANSTLNSDASLFSAASSRSSTTIPDDDEEIVISDPDSDEEAYVSLFPEYLAIEVEAAIRSMTARAQARSSSSLRTTKQGILSFLQRDDRWRKVGEWSVEEALEYLQDDGRAVIDKGLWRLLS
ncbi:hypothetical protein K435DRAFT_959384 [Dendrothele bispora CBS 962.96]|uniref:CST complex subunit STN1 n=1 Tax=Dendrothele bispora (strain CBS 962.96) TaxID=1314807 RepID=A0A4S8MX22_DENBC|nr:hypothetical protein K435DRAFT_959384 [Dendrothele bispora CBS 962.96]